MVYKREPAGDHVGVTYDSDATVCQKAVDRCRPYAPFDNIFTRTPPLDPAYRLPICSRAYCLSSSSPMSHKSQL
jgi:hypothetical protein